MAGVLYPDFLGTLSKAAAFESNRAQTDYLNEDRAAKAEIAPLIPKALQGDKEALNQIGTRHPDTFTKLMPMLQSIDANQRAKVKETSEWTTRAAMGVLSLPENERPAAYQAALADGQRLGYKIDMPPQYDRAVEGRLKHILNQARPIADYWKNQDEGVTLVPSGGGGGMAPGGFTGQVAKDESGGNYNIPNAKGSGAYGKYQFMPDTWASVAQSNPQLNLPMNIRQATPQQQEAAMEAFTRMNGQQLAQSGVPATPANLYLAHRFGAAGATRFLSAPDNTPIAQVFPANWIQQNPDLNTTVGQFKRGVQSRYGGIPAGREVDIASNAAPMPEPPAGMAVPGTPAPMPQPPGLAQGDAAPRGDASGNPIQTSDGGMVPRESMKMITPNLPPGTSLAKDRKTGRYIVQEGHFVVYDDATKNPVGLYPIPKIKEPGAAPSGYQFSPDGRSLQVIPGGPADKPQGTGPFTGNSVDAQALNMLVATGVLTARQAAELAAGKTVTDPETKQMIFMTPSGIFGQNPGQAPQPLAGPPAPGVAAPQGVAPMPSAGGPQAGVPAPSAPAPANSGAIPLTGTKATGQPTPKEIQDIRTARAEAETIIKTLEDFRNESKNATTPDRLLSLSGATTGLNTSYNVAALLAKGEALFNLGVLNGPDLDIIRRTLPDPSTIRGGAASSKAVDAAVDKVINVIKTKVEAREKQLGIGPAPQQPAPQSAAEKGRDEFNASKIPAPARDRLKANPTEAAQFDEIFGKGAAAAVLGR